MANILNIKIEKLEQSDNYIITFLFDNGYPRTFHLKSQQIFDALDNFVANSFIEHGE